MNKLYSEGPLLLWQPEPLNSKVLPPMQSGDMSGTRRRSHWTLFQRERVLWCVCLRGADLSAEQRRQTSHSHSTDSYPLWFSSSSSSPLSLRIKWLFVLPQRCLSLVSPRLPSPPFSFWNERIFLGTDLPPADSTTLLLFLFFFYFRQEKGQVNSNPRSG